MELVGPCQGRRVPVEEIVPWIQFNFNSAENPQSRGLRFTTFSWFLHKAMLIVSQNAHLEKTGLFHYVRFG